MPAEQSDQPNTKAMVALAVGLGLQFALGLFVSQPQEAILTTLLTAACIFGVRKLCRAATHQDAFRWFRRFPPRGAFVVFLTVLAACLALYYLGPKALVQLPLVFYWFWLFAAIDTYFRSAKSSNAGS
jgi:hypothetical protein